LIDKIRREALQYYYDHKEESAKRMREYHKRIKDYADEHKISFEEALKRGAGRKKGGEQE